MAHNTECGDRPRSAADEQARADLGRAMRAGEPVDEIFESLVGPLVENAAAGRHRRTP